MKLQARLRDGVGFKAMFGEVGDLAVGGLEGKSVGALEGPFWRCDSKSPHSRCLGGARDGHAFAAAVVGGLVRATWGSCSAS